MKTSSVKIMISEFRRLFGNPLVVFLMLIGLVFTIVGTMEYSKFPTLNAYNAPFNETNITAIRDEVLLYYHIANGDEITVEEGVILPDFSPQEAWLFAAQVEFYQFLLDHQLGAYEYVWLDHIDSTAYINLSTVRTIRTLQTAYWLSLGIAILLGLGLFAYPKYRNTLKNSFLANPNRKQIYRAKTFVALTILGAFQVLMLLLCWTYLIDGPYTTVVIRVGDGFQYISLVWLMVIYTLLSMIGSMLVVLFLGWLSLRKKETSFYLWVFGILLGLFALWEIMDQLVTWHFGFFDHIWTLLVPWISLVSAPPLYMDGRLVIIVFVHLAFGIFFFWSMLQKIEVLDLAN
ncbi:MAG: hypothetical protein PHP32_01820 [Candidatus Izemoplasmatales bacterium]|nr:hypothetical protein [Candidatus Izemoplasmatales bacterium]